MGVVVLLARIASTVVYSTVVIHLYLTTLLLNGFINVDVIGFYPRLVKYVYGHANLELEYIKSNCFTKSY